jgi:antitoxin HigA-1
VSTSNNITEGPAAPQPGPDLMAEWKPVPGRRRPTHPGELIKMDLEALGLTTYAAAPLLGVTRMALGNVIAEKSAVSPEMALKLGKFFGNGYKIWMAMQAEVDAWEAYQRIKDQLAKIKPAEWDREEIEEP